jgi:hypothetical protein
VYDTDGFITGNLIGDEVIVSPRREFNFQYLRWSKLVGNRLYGFRILETQNNTGLSFLQFCNIELVTLTEKTIEVPFPPSDNQATPIVCVSFQSQFLITVKFRNIPIVGVEICCGLHSVKYVKSAVVYVKCLFIIISFVGAYFGV